MYWENPKVQIWDFTICEMSITEDWTLWDSIRIVNEETWEWMEIGKGILKKDMKAIFDKYM